MAVFLNTCILTTLNLVSSSDDEPENDDLNTLCTRIDYERYDSCADVDLIVGNAENLTPRKILSVRQTRRARNDTVYNVWSYYRVPRIELDDQ